MKKELDDGEYGDWENVFHYAEPRTIDPVIGSKVSTDKFDRGDVEEIFHLEEGENDGPDWLLVGKLHDGRFFSLRAGCDYTGWG